LGKKPQGVEFRDFLLQMLDAGGRRLGFEPIEHGLRLFRAHHEERIQGGTNWGGESDGHAVIDILKEAVEGGLDNPVEFLYRW
jgi:hypothetical protein